MRPNKSVGGSFWRNAFGGDLDTESSADDLAALSASIGGVLAAECDRRALHRFFDEQGDLDDRLWALAAEQGWLGIGLPQAYGGLELGAAGLDVLYRALGRAIAPGAFTPTLAAAQWLAEVGAAGLREEFLPTIISGACTAAVPLNTKETTLALAGETISGTTPLMLGARNPSIAIVHLRHNEVPSIALFRIDSVTALFESAEGWDRTRYVGRLRLKGAEPIACIDDASGAAASVLRRCLGLAVAGDCVGGARASAEQTIHYLKDRVQFGRALASFQALKHRAADLMCAVILSEEMLNQAVGAMAGGAPSAAMWADLAKASAAEKFRLVAEDCLQLHGGVGFTWQFDCHILLKRALLNREIGGNAGALRDHAAEYFAWANGAGETTAELNL